MTLRNESQRTGNPGPAVTIIVQAHSPAGRSILTHHAVNAQRGSQITWGSHRDFAIISSNKTGKTAKMRGLHKVNRQRLPNTRIAIAVVVVGSYGVS